MQSWKHIPTNIFTLDMALLGGIPRSLVTLCYGYAGAGKTTLAHKVIAQAQRMFPEQEAAFVDVEGRMDKAWAAKNGVDLDRLWQVQPNTGEEALDLAEELVRIPEISLIVVDSLAALMPYKEAQVSTEDDLPGLQARLIGKFCRKTGSALVDMRNYDHFPAMLWLNQWRSKLTMFGDPRVLPGGIAQHNFSSVKIEMLNKEIEGKDEFDINTVETNEHSFRIVKNSYGIGIRHGEFEMIRNPSNPLGQGFINDGKTVCTYARKFGLITGGGSGGFAVEGLDKKFRVLDDIVEYLYQNKEFFEALKYKIISLYRVNNGLDGDGWL
jgi:recombination protein RecA